MTDLPDPFHWKGSDIGASFDAGHVLFTCKRNAPLDRDANRERIAQLGGVPRRILWGPQVHGTTVLRDAPSGTQADGQVTVKQNTAAMVFTADCVPVALLAEGGVAMLHAGWRGVAGGIVPAGVNVLRAATKDAPVTAVIGPGARGCCYEVGDEVHERFANYRARQDQNLALERVIASQLSYLGVEDVHDTGQCTMCNPIYFSHRRDAGTKGRQGNLVWRV